MMPPPETMEVELSPSELERYDRQIMLFGVEGQAKLKKSKVMVAGLGGLGCPLAIYMTASGVGKLLLIDRERIELSNLSRQILHWTPDVGRLKVESAAEKLRELNPEVDVEAVAAEISEENARELVSEVDLVLDGIDNWKTRFLLNRACVELSKPFIHAGVYGMGGQMMTIIPGRGPCLRCLLPRPPPEVRPFPVLGTAPAVLAALQATEAIKILTGYGEPAVGKLLIYDGYTMSFREVRVSRRPDCPVCAAL